MIEVTSTTRVFDAHVHIQPWRMLKPGAYETFKKSHPDFERLLEFADDPLKFLAFLDREGIERVALINYVSPDVMGFTDEVNEFVSRYCQTAPDRLIPCGSLHPRYTQDPARQMDYLINDLKIKIIKIHPPHQLFYANDYLHGLEALGVIYEKAQEYGIPVLVHTGTSIFPGARAKYGDPLALDDVALDFPKLKIILAHGGRPFWTEESFFLLRRHTNLYFDISSIPPQNLLKYFPRLEELADKTLFGSDWPGPGVKSIRANVEKFLELALSEETKRKILYDNAMKLFFGA
ncbi:MAG: amidohydrolase family protein [Candidatus Bipolaricaulota bacterium]|nr:amidohydrolase family protein [Candidatus Bipolaricaulota bacterium]MCS7274034.1 amidohydrolase family protein [Candidatus Bipolaricaulota bacterium]MDW8110234.1 amidohydrolase family protein [Candidatus Bipolaricaulota bacterium]MDW8328866.1 amidohydrolase family protein [Candidatus Bipolaricaulota bacterium]